MKNRLPILPALVLLVWGVPVLLHAQTYNIYFGDIHSQTWYSDGNKEQNSSTYTLPVARAITYARDVANDMDFLGISDHNHVDGGFPMSLTLWRSGQHEADSLNQDGTFVGFYGQEWGTGASDGGHSLIYGTDKLIGWNPGVYDIFVPKNNYTALFDTLRGRNAFCYLAHPGTGDYDSIALKPYNALWDSVVKGVSMKNGPALTAGYTESDPASGNYESYFHSMLKLGYHVAPIANQDNHYTNFGMLNQQRTAVLAPSLTRANVVDALRNRRAYATEDHNLQLRFEVGTRQMGEVFTHGGSIPFRIKVTDTDGANLISSIQVRYGIPGSGVAPTTLTTASNVDSLVFSQSQTFGTTYYYYVLVTETNGRRAWSAPMWITIGTVAPPAAFDQTSPASGSTNQAASGSLTWQSSSGATQYDVYLGTTNPPTTIVSADQAGTSYGYSGLANSTVYYWKIVAKNGNGSVDATTAPWSFTIIMAAPGSFSLSAPTNAGVNQSISGSLSWQAAANAVNYDVYLSTTNPPTTVVSANQAGTSYGYSGLSNNTPYYWKIVAKNIGGNTTATGTPWTFTTIVMSPGSFSQTSPANTAIDQSTSGTLVWAASANAASYDVYLDTNASPITLVSANQVGTSYAYAGLVIGKAYYWKIIAKNAAGTLAATGSPWTFTTIVATPGSFSQTTPTTGATGVSTAGTLLWQPSSNVTTYDVYLDTSAVPSVIVSANQVGESYGYSGLVDEKTYYWKVVAKNASASVPATSSPWSFTTLLPVPDSFLLKTPIAAAPSQLLSGNLTWAKSEFVSSYDVYLDVNDPPTILIAPDAIDTVYAYSGLLAGTSYHWKIIAKNASGETAASNGPRSFTTETVPVAPTDVATVNVNTTSLGLIWIDNASNEDGYRVHRSTVSTGPFSQSGVDLPPNSSTYSDTGLAINTRYYYRVTPFNVIGEGAFGAADHVTLAAVPGAPSISGSSYTGFVVSVGQNGNPSSTTYCLRLIDETTTRFVQANGSLGQTPVWRTSSQWGGAGGVTITGLQACSNYEVDCKGRNIDAVETSFGPSSSWSTSCYSFSSNVVSGWNLLSLPVIVSDLSKSALFPSSLSEAFAFQGSYVARETLNYNEGFWLKFGGASSIYFAGTPRVLDTIKLSPGWNIIGSATQPIAIGAIVQEPGSTVSSNYFGYLASGYYPADSLKPMNGYWVKAAAAGSLIINAAVNVPSAMMKPTLADELKQMNSFEFEDVTGRKQSLYVDHGRSEHRMASLAEMPPLPPENAFDVRFASQHLVERIRSEKTGSQSFSIRLHGIVAPLRFSWNTTQDIDHAYQLTEAGRTTSLQGNGSMTISNPGAEMQLAVVTTSANGLPKEYSLYQNFPNPFNPSTQIRYDLPAEGHVYLTISNILGSTVESLVDERQPAGSYHVDWSPKLASGIYFYRLEVRNSTGVLDYNQIRRIALVK